MKTFKLVMIVLTFIGTSCFAQHKTDGLKTGKYYENTLKNKYVGTWSSSDMKIQVSTRKRDVRQGNMNFSADYAIVKILKFSHKGSNATSYFKESMELISLDNNKQFTGYYRDPMTGNHVKIELNFIDDNTIELKSSLPEYYPENDNSKGTSFPKATRFSK